MHVVHFNLHTALLDWQVGPFPMLVLAACIAAGIWYLRADWVLATRGRKWRGQRTVSFFTGLFTVDLALQSPVATLTNNYFQAHVIQHLLLMIIAPALLAMGAPMTLILQTSSRHSKTVWLRIFHSRGFAVLSHPLTVWVLYYGVMLAFFLTSRHWLRNEPHVADGRHQPGLPVRSDSVLVADDRTGPHPRWGASYPLRMVNLLIGVPLESFLAIALLSSRQTIAPMYTLSSTHTGAGVLVGAVGAADGNRGDPDLLPVDGLRRSQDRREDARLDAEALLQPSQPDGLRSNTTQVQAADRRGFQSGTR